jgi:hypothetical protein
MSKRTAVSHIPQFGDTASPPGDVDMSAGDVHLQCETAASPNFGICNTAQENAGI